MDLNELSAKNAEKRIIPDVNHVKHIAIVTQLKTDFVRNAQKTTVKTSLLNTKGKRYE